MIFPCSCAKEQTMKAQERERELQEEKRLRLEKENEKQDELLRFHRIGVASQPLRPCLRWKLNPQ